jgi:hypothetical protein
MKRTEPTSPPPASASTPAMAEVLGNGDLLHEILLRLSFPTCPVRTAAVCRHWLRLASHPAFLRRFRKLHLPHLLGFYLVTYCKHPFPRFVPLPQHLEHAAVIHRSSFELGQEVVSDCSRGHLVLSLNGGFVVRSPLQPGRGTITLPKLLPPAVQGSDGVYSRDVFLTEGNGGSMSYTAVTLMCSGLRLKVHISKLQGEAWCNGRSFDLIELPQHRARWNKLGLIACGKLYMVCAAGYIIGIDLPSLSLFYIKLPEVVVEHAYQANSTGSISNGDWKLFDAFCLLRQFGHLADPSWPPGVSVHVDAVGDNAKFVFLRIHSEVFYMCMCTRTVKKVYDLTQGYRQSRYLFGVHPFMMVCAPTFPMLKHVHDQED